VAHVAEYTILGALLARALDRPLAAFLTAVAYAATDELHQHFVSGRTGAVVDVGIDAVGGALGVAASLLWSRARSSRRSSRTAA
jgi:VanZ family protein